MGIRQWYASLTGTRGHDDLRWFLIPKKNYKTDEPKESLNALCTRCRAQELCRQGTRTFRMAHHRPGAHQPVR
ncbi:hypothetical protein EMIT0P176_20180 [Pseudomonas sp. IT-P176]